MAQVGKGTLHGISRATVHMRHILHTTPVPRLLLNYAARLVARPMISTYH